MPRRAARKTVAGAERRAARCAGKTQVAASPRPGAPCPRCHKGILAYNGIVQLVCSACGHIAESGAFS